MSAVMTEQQIEATVSCYRAVKNAIDLINRLDTEEFYRQAIRMNRGNELVVKDLRELQRQGKSRDEVVKFFEDKVVQAFQADFRHLRCEPPISENEIRTTLLKITDRTERDFLLPRDVLVDRVMLDRIMQVRREAFEKSMAAIGMSYSRPLVSDVQKLQSENDALRLRIAQLERQQGLTTAGAEFVPLKVARDQAALSTDGLSSALTQAAAAPPR